jgi:hypothetical protein
MTPHKPGARAEVVKAGFILKDFLRVLIFKPGVMDP